MGAVLDQARRHVPPECHAGACRVSREHDGTQESHMQNFNPDSCWEISEAPWLSLGCSLCSVPLSSLCSSLLSPSSPSLCDVFSSSHTPRRAANAASSLSRAHTRTCTHTPHTVCTSPADTCSRVPRSVSTHTSQASRPSSAFWAFPSLVILMGVASWPGFCLESSASGSQPVPALERSLGWWVTSLSL